MTVWRVTVEDDSGTSQDVVIDAPEEATVLDLWSELASRFQIEPLTHDGEPIEDPIMLENSPLRHGSYISTRTQEPEPGPGWYLVAVAGPDTGVWIPITSEGVSVGRHSSCSLVVKDSALSGRHFVVRLADQGVVIEDLRSTNGTIVEGDLVKSQTELSDGTYIGAGVTTFGILRIDSSAIAPEFSKIGSTIPFQRRFRDALNPLPKSLTHPSPPSDNAASSRRSILSYIIPLLSTAGFGLLMARPWEWGEDGFDSTRLLIMLPIMALGPLFIAIDSLRRRKSEARANAEKKADYEQERSRLIERLERVRRDERDRDRWAATPAGIASLLTRIRHSKLWERSDSDEDFCEVAIGLYGRPSDISVEGRPDNSTLPFDNHWAAVLRHSLVREGSLAVIGPMARTRALARSLLLDLATSHSPNDVKIGS